MDPDRDPTLDQTIFFSDLKNENFSSYFFLITYPRANYCIFNLKNLIFCKKFVLKFYFASIISIRSIPLWERIRDPNLWLMDPDPGGPKTCGDPYPQHCLFPLFNSSLAFIPAFFHFAFDSPSLSSSWSSGPLRSLSLSAPATAR